MQIEGATESVLSKLILGQLLSYRRQNHLGRLLRKGSEGQRHSPTKYAPPFMSIKENAITANFHVLIHFTSPQAS